MSVLNKLASAVGRNDEIPNQLLAKEIAQTNDAIADRKAADIWKHIDTIFESTDKGSVITQDWGIRVLATVAAQNKAYEKRILPFLKSFLESCPAKDLPRHLESCLVAINKDNRGDIVTILEARKPS